MQTIIETASIANIIPFIDAGSWLLIDLDNTMFEAVQAYGHANWFYEEVHRRQQKGMSREEAIRDTYPQWTKSQQTCAVKPVEEGFISFLTSLQKQGVVTMGLTHRQTCLAESTLRQVDSLGFDFTETAPSKETFVVPASYPTLYTQGILFVGDFNKKSDVFLSFFSPMQKQPKNVIFIDDKKENVEDLKILFSRLEIPYVGIHYTAILEKSQSLDN